MKEIGLSSLKVLDGYKWMMQAPHIPIQVVQWVSTLLRLQGLEDSDCVDLEEEVASIRAQYPKPQCITPSVPVLLPNAPIANLHTSGFWQGSGITTYS